MKFLTKIQIGTKHEGFSKKIGCAFYLKKTIRYGKLLKF